MDIGKKRVYLIGIMVLIFVFTVFSILNGTNAFAKLVPQGNSILTVEEQLWLKEQGTLIYAADNNAPPLRFIDKADNQYKGAVVDYINLLSLELGVNIELHPLPWEDALNKLEKGETDICDMFASKERAKKFLFSDTIYNLRAVVVSRSGNEELDRIERMTIATQKGDYVNEYLLEHYPGIELIYVENVSSALDLLLSGKVDGVAGDEPVVLYEIKNKGAEELLHIQEKPLYENEVVFALPKSKPELKSILDKGIAAIKETGQLERIQQKWFGISAPIVQSPDYSGKIRTILIIAGLLVLLVLAMVAWNYFLKQEVEKRTVELLNSKNDLQITFDGMTEYVVVFDLDLRVMNINRSFLEVLGYSKSRVVNKHWSEIFKDLSIIDMERIVLDTIQLEKTIEEEIVNKNDYYAVRTYPLKNTRGVMKNVLVVIQNITKEKITERQILQANKMAAIGELAAGMGHEIRNPLGIIRNHSYMMRDLYQEEKASRSLDYIDASVERASRIIDNLLDFSRLTGDEKVWIHLEQFITKLFELEHKTLMRLNIDYSIECPKEIKIYSNMDSLKHIFINLISNAVDAIQEKGSIRVRVSSTEGRVVIQIEDDGEGIHGEEMEKIFNPFYTTKDPGKGTGLGLYIVYNEVEKLNGGISVTSVPGVKTIFEVDIPTNAKE